MTSLVFMLVEVPEPVWKTSIGNCVVPAPRGDLGGRVLDRLGDVRVEHARARALTLAAARLDPGQRLDLGALRARCPEIGKFSTARCVCARHLASAGTRTSPIESCSMRYSAARLRTLVGHGRTSRRTVDTRTARVPGTSRDPVRTAARHESDPDPSGVSDSGRGSGAASCGAEPGTARRGAAGAVPPGPDGVTRPGRAPGST